MCGLVAVLLGLSYARIGGGVSVWWPMVSGLMVLVVARKKDLGTLLAVVACGFLIGWWRGGAVLQQAVQYQQFFGSTVTVSGRVLDDPVYDNRGRLDFRVGPVSIDDQPLPGQVRVRALIGDLRRGDSVKVSGTLVDGFGNYQAAMYFGMVTITARSNNPIELLRREFFATIYSVLPEPQASLGLGFLVGLRSALPDDFDEELRIAGLTHIVVASGYNLTILVRLSRRLLAKYSKYQAFTGSLALILAFLVVTGASPSMVRASVVTILSLVAWYYGRKFRPLLIILLSAAATALYSPLFIWHDLGWWLSFLAFAGVLILAPLLSNRIWGEKQPFFLAQIAVETTAAQVLALPLIMFTFSEVSLVSLFANIAVVPLIPFAMIGAFVAGVAGIFMSTGVAAWLAVPANWILSYIVSATQFFARPDWAKQHIELSVLGMLGLYGLVVALILVLHAKATTKLENLSSVVE